MINRVILTGRLTRDIELRQTSDGLVFTYFTLAVSKRTSRDVNNTDFVPCVAWGQTANLMKKTLHKGSLIGVEGRIEVYTTQNNGQYETRVNVNVSQMSFLESKQSQSNQSIMNENSFDKPQEYKDTSELFFNDGNQINFDDINQNINSSSSDEINFDDIKF